MYKAAKAKILVLRQGSINMKNVIFVAIATIVLAGCTAPNITNVNIGDKKGSKVKVFSSNQEIEITS